MLCQRFRGRGGLKSRLNHAVRIAGALAASGWLAACVSSLAALEWKSPRGTRTAESQAALADEVPTPLPPVAVAPVKRTSVERRKAAAPDVGVSERLELSNGTELVWVTDQDDDQQRSAARPASAKRTAPARSARPTSLDTASTLNSRALGARAQEPAPPEVPPDAESSSPPADAETAHPGNVAGNGNSCCGTNAGNGGSSCGSPCGACSGYRGAGCGRCRGCGRLGCVGCRFCGHGSYIDRYANCNCDGSYKYPVPPLYTYHWPGLYSHQLVTDYHSPWRYPPLRPYTDEPSDEQLAPVE